MDDAEGKYRYISRRVCKKNYVYNIGRLMSITKDRPEMDLTASTQHGAFFYSNDRWWYMDFSTNGTWLKMSQH